MPPREVIITPNHHHRSGLINSSLIARRIPVPDMSRFFLLVGTGFNVFVGSILGGRYARYMGCTFSPLDLIKSRRWA